MNYKYAKEKIICPLCMCITMGEKREDGAVIAKCHRCKTVIYGKRYKRKIMLEAKLANN